MLLWPTLDQWIQAWDPVVQLLGRSSGVGTLWGGRAMVVAGPSVTMNEKLAWEYVNIEQNEGKRGRRLVSDSILWASGCSHTEVPLYLPLYGPVTSCDRVNMATVSLWLLSSRGGVCFLIPWTWAGLWLALPHGNWWEQHCVSSGHWAPRSLEANAFGPLSQGHHVRKPVY